MLVLRIVCFTQGVSKEEGDGQHSGRLHSLGVFLDQYDASGGHASFFYDSRNHADSVRASRSSRGQQHDFYSFILESAGHLRPGILNDSRHVS